VRANIGPVPSGRGTGLRRACVPAPARYSAGYLLPARIPGDVEPDRIPPLRVRPAICALPEGAARRAHRPRPGARPAGQTAFTGADRRCWAKLTVIRARLRQSRNFSEPAIRTGTMLASRTNLVSEWRETAGAPPGAFSTSRAAEIGWLQEQLRRHSRTGLTPAMGGTWRLCERSTCRVSRHEMSRGQFWSGHVTGLGPGA
jgi:hypothetical protein